MDKIFRLIGKQDWLRFGIRDRLIRKYCNPDTIPSKEFETDFFDLKYMGNLGSYIDWNVYFYGAYEKQILFLCRDLVKKSNNPIFVDVGANVGHHSLYMSKYCDSVHSFEPNPSLILKIEEKIKMNAAKNMFVHNVGLGEKNIRLPYFSPQGCNKGTGSFIQNYSANNSEKSELLQVVNGDEYISKLELKNIDLIKIDVEGFEKNVLIGLNKTIKKYKPKIVLEYGASTKNSFSDLNEFIELIPKEYKIMEIITDRPRYKLFNSTQYKLQNFDFNITGNLLLFPT